MKLICKKNLVRKENDYTNSSIMIKLLNKTGNYYSLNL